MQKHTIYKAVDYVSKVSIDFDGDLGREGVELRKKKLGDGRFHCAPVICKYDSALKGRINVTH